MDRKLIFVVLLLVVIGLPFVFQAKEKVALSGDNSVVIISPHNESIRHKFSLGFSEWY